VSVEKRQIVLPRSVWIALGVLGSVLLLYVLRGVLTPIFLAFTIAYVLDPVVDRLQAWKLPRPAGIAVVLAAFTAAIVVFLAMVVPRVAREVAAVADALPGQVAQLLQRLEPLLARLGVDAPQSATEWATELQSHATGFAGELVAPVGHALQLVIGGTFSALGAVVAALIVPVFAVYFLADFDNLVAGARDLTPARWRPRVVEYASEIDLVLGQFMRGQLAVMGILAVLYGVTYSILGVPLAIPIGIAAGLLNFIPYVGSAFALVAGLLLAALGGGGGWQIAGVVIAYAVIQTLEGFVITPRIVGKTVGLGEVWVLLALYVGGEIFGFLGVLLALPAAAVLKIFVERGVQYYRASSLYTSPSPDS